MLYGYRLVVILLSACCVFGGEDNLATTDCGLSIIIDGVEICVVQSSILLELATSRDFDDKKKLLALTEVVQAKCQQLRIQHKDCPLVVDAAYKVLKETEAKTRASESFEEEEEDTRHNTSMRPSCLDKNNRYLQTRVSIRVLCYKRPQALRRLLDSLSRAFYPKNITINMYVYVDSPGGEESADVARNFSISSNWTLGQVIVSIAQKHLGVQGQWRGMWNGGASSDISIVFEDDVEVSPFFFAWMWCGAAQSAIFGTGSVDLRKKRKIAAVSLKPFILNPLADARHPILVPPPRARDGGADLILSDAISSHGLVIFSNVWQSFLHWWNECTTSCISACDATGVVTLVDKYWKKAIEAGRENSMWTWHWQCFLRNQGLKTLSPNVGGFGFATHHRDAGEHFDGLLGPDVKLVSRWIDLEEEKLRTLMMVKNTGQKTFIWSTCRQSLPYCLTHSDVQWSLQPFSTQASCHIGGLSSNSVMRAGSRLTVSLRSDASSPPGAAHMEVKCPDFFEVSVTSKFFAFSTHAGGAYGNCTFDGSNWVYPVSILLPEYSEDDPQTVTTTLRVIHASANGSWDIRPKYVNGIWRHQPEHTYTVVGSVSARFDVRSSSSMHSHACVSVNTGYGWWARGKHEKGWHWQPSGCSLPSLFYGGKYLRRRGVLDFINKLDIWGKTLWVLGDSHARKLIDTLIVPLLPQGLRHGSPFVTRNKTETSMCSWPDCFCPIQIEIYESGHVIERNFDREEPGPDGERFVTIVYRMLLVPLTLTKYYTELPDLNDLNKNEGCALQDATNFAENIIPKWRRKNFSWSYPSYVIWSVGNWGCSHNTWDDYARNLKALLPKLLSATDCRWVVVPPMYFGRKAPCGHRLLSGGRTRQFFDLTLKAVTAADVDVLDTYAMVQGDAERQQLFFEDVGTPGYWELCFNHQRPQVYRIIWQMIRSTWSSTATSTIAENEAGQVFRVFGESSKKSNTNEGVDPDVESARLLLEYAHGLMYNTPAPMPDTFPSSGVGVEANSIYDHLNDHNLLLKFSCVLLATIFVSLVKGSIAQGAAILELWGWAVVARMLDALMSAESLHPPRMDSFCVVMCVLTVLAITSARRSTSGSISQLSRPTLTTLRGAMQLYLLAYHRCGLIFHGVLPFAIARVCVAAYYFLSSYGRACSIMSAESADLIFIERLWSHLGRPVVRILLFATMLSFATETLLEEYYFVLVCSINHVIIFASLELARLFTDHSSLVSALRLATTCCIVTFAIYKMPVQLENYIVVSDMFKTRLRLDCYASVCGVIVASLKDKYKRTHHDFSVGLLGFVVWCIAVHKAKTQKDYMSIHPYVGLAVLPAATSAASWFIRNIGQSSLLLWVGKNSLYLYLGQFHFFLAKGASQGLIILPRSWGMDGSNLLISGALLVIVAWRCAQLDKRCKEIFM